MNPAARELGLIAYAKQREPILAKARAMREAMNLAPASVLLPVLLLGIGDRA